MGTALLGAASIALAETSTTTPATSPAPFQQMIVQIGPRGNALLRGIVDAVGANTITVKSWGGDWTISMGGDAKLMPEGVSLSDVHAGDFVGVQGSANANAPWTIDAKIVRDWTERHAVRQEERQNIQSVHSTESQGRENGIGRIFEGTASAVSGTSFTLTANGGKVYTVNASGAKLLNRRFLTLGSVTSIQVGDHVRVFGTAASSTVSAQVVRDVSVK